MDFYIGSYEILLHHRLGIVIICLNQLQWFRVLTHPKQLSKRVDHKTRHWSSALQASLPWLLWNMPPAQASSDVAAKISVARGIGKGAVSKISRIFVKWLDSSQKFPSSHCPSKLLSQFLVDHHFAGDMIWHISGELDSFQPSLVGTVHDLYLGGTVDFQV